MNSLNETALGADFLSSHSHSIVYRSKNCLEATLRNCARKVVEFYIFKIMRTQARLVLRLLWRCDMGRRRIDELPINGL